MVQTVTRNKKSACDCNLCVSVCVCVWISKLCTWNSYNTHTTCVLIHIVIITQTPLVKRASNFLLSLFILSFSLRMLLSHSHTKFVLYALINTLQLCRKSVTYQLPKLKLKFELCRVELNLLCLNVSKIGCMCVH